MHDDDFGLGDEGHIDIDDLLNDLDFQSFSPSENIGDFTRGQKMVLSGFITQYWDAIRMHFNIDDIDTAKKLANTYYHAYMLEGRSNTKYEYAIEAMNNYYMGHMP